MAWGRNDRRRDEPRPSADALLSAAYRTFGDHPVEDHGDHRIRVDGLDYAYDPSADPPFILVPECDRCGGHDIEQFPLETWTVDGARIRAQARSTCRDCRFLASPLETGRQTRSAG